MRLMRSTPLIVGLMALLCGATANAADPRDPFGQSATAPTPTSMEDERPDPFGPARQPIDHEPLGLKDPFTVRAPSCPLRTTDDGVVIQRPTSAVCQLTPQASPLQNPWDT